MILGIDDCEGPVLQNDQPSSTAMVLNMVGGEESEFEGNQP